MDPRMMALSSAMGSMPDDAAAPAEAAPAPGGDKGAAVAAALSALEPFIDDVLIAQAAQLLQDSLSGAGPEADGAEDSEMDMQEGQPLS